MNNLQLIAHMVNQGQMTIHNPSPRCRFYTVAMAGYSVSHESLPVALDMACERLRGEALVIEPRMA